MAHHHKSNKAVEGDPYAGHGRGLPRRPDQDALAERTAEDRRAAGLPDLMSRASDADAGTAFDADVEADAGRERDGS
ncbi:hypothetical protein ACIQPQ_10500 [Streptomyces sp. NPDC091281]|uniref:hypothetical protein n=1 Tax=Streptomyces sp. NPDC091281 TaxID=3365985 RepID=UPI003830EF5C